MIQCDRTISAMSLYRAAPVFRDHFVAQSSPLYESVRAQCIDEFRLYVHPIIIGSGKPLFAASDAKLNLRLVEARSFGNGVVPLRYERVE